MVEELVALMPLINKEAEKKPQEHSNQESALPIQAVEKDYEAA